MRFLCRSEGFESPELFATDDIDDAVAELNSQWDRFIACYEFEFADVGGGGVFFDVTEKVCNEWLNWRERGNETVEVGLDGEAEVPKVVKDYCADRVAEIEGEAADWEAEQRAMHRDYYNSLGVGRNW